MVLIVASTISMELARQRQQDIRAAVERHRRLDPSPRGATAADTGGRAAGAPRLGCAEGLPTCTTGSPR